MLGANRWATNGLISSRRLCPANVEVVRIRTFSSFRWPFLFPRCLPLACSVSFRLASLALDRQRSNRWLAEEDEEGNWRRSK